MISVIFWCGLAVIALLSWVIWDKRYRRNHGTAIPPGYILTAEVFIDPISGKELRVYYDPQTGDRFYREA